MHQRPVPPPDPAGPVDGPYEAYDRPHTHVVPDAPYVAGPPYNYRLVQAVWLITGIVDTLIAIRFLLKLLGASPASAFVSFMYGITEPLVAPFQGIFPAAGHGYYLMEPASLVAIAIYALLGVAVVAAVKLVTAPRRMRTVD